MASQPLNDLPEPKKTSDAVTRKYVDDLIADNVGVGNIDSGGSPFFKEMIIIRLRTLLIWRLRSC